MFASKKEVPKKSENDAKKDDGTKEKEWIEVKPGTFRWQVAGEEVKETIPKPTKGEEKKKEEEEIEIENRKNAVRTDYYFRRHVLTGLRAIRYARELDDVKCIVANDLDPTAALAVENNKAIQRARIRRSESAGRQDRDQLRRRSRGCVAT